MLHTAEHLWFLPVFYLEGEEALECTDLLSCSLEGGGCIPGWAMFGLTVLHREWRWKIVTREVAGLCCGDVSTTGECFLGLLCERDCVKCQHCCPTRTKMGTSCCLQAEKGKKMVSSIFSCVNKPVLVPDSKLFGSYYFLKKLFRGRWGEGLFWPTDSQVQDMYVRFEGN